MRTGICIVDCCESSDSRNEGVVSRSLLSATDPLVWCIFRLDGRLVNSHCLFLTACTVLGFAFHSLRLPRRNFGLEFREQWLQLGCGVGPLTSIVYLFRLCFFLWRFRYQVIDSYELIVSELWPFIFWLLQIFLNVFYLSGFDQRFV